MPRAGSVSVCIFPFTLSLSKGDFPEPRDGSCFDKLSTNGKLRHYPRAPIVSIQQGE
jgi:hypothetical protein